MACIMLLDLSICPQHAPDRRIKIGNRSVLDYVLNPITRVIDESFREP
jgi:hypothetical protein